METILILLEIAIAIAALYLVYLIYQIPRNEEIYRIRIKWIEQRDKRWHQYSYDFMFDPNTHNLFGLKWPMESDYPPKENQNEKP